MLNPHWNSKIWCRTDTNPVSCNYGLKHMNAILRSNVKQCCWHVRYTICHQKNKTQFDSAKQLTALYLLQRIPNGKIITILQSCKSSLVSFEIDCFRADNKIVDTASPLHSLYLINYFETCICMISTRSSNVGRLFGFSSQHWSISWYLKTMHKREVSIKFFILSVKISLAWY
jgi:hypothetical protein